VCVLESFVPCGQCADLRTIPKHHLVFRAQHKLLLPQNECLDGYLLSGCVGSKSLLQHWARAYKSSLAHVSALRGPMCSHISEQPLA
jgi:hypothetical protein